MFHDSVGDEGPSGSSHFTFPSSDKDTVMRRQGGFSTS